MSLTREPVRIGFIGCGNITRTHASAARGIPGVEIVAFHGTNAGRTAALAAEHGAAPYEDLGRFLAHQSMDMVAIGSPSGLHAAHGIAAARRGLHVLVEKPIDISVDRAEALIAATDRAGVKLGVFFQDRLKPDIVRMKALVDEGRLGRPVLGSGRVKWHRPAEYYAGSRWRGTRALDGGGALINQAIHTVDLLAWMFGAVAGVSARVATRVHDIETEDTAVAVLEFESGALGVLEAATSVYPGYARRVELTGSSGTIILEHDRLASVHLGDHIEVHESPSQGPIANVTSAAVSDDVPHRRILEDFIRAIAEDGVPACDGREALRSVAIVEAIYASARTGRQVAPAESSIGLPKETSA